MFMVLLPKKYNLNLIMKKLETNSKWKTFHKTYLSSTLQNVKVIREKVTNYPRLEQMKKIWQLNAMSDPGLDPGPGKGH